MPDLTRRHFLVAAGGAVVTAACSNDGGEPSAPAGEEVTPTSTTSVAIDSTTSSPPAPAPTVLEPADFDELDLCVLMPAAAAGPFPLDEQFVRRDITEGYPGHALRLGLRVQDAACAPVAGAAVEIWHTDATGDYSAFADGGGGKDEGPGTTFLRGTQIADDDGIVEFHTLYPGWYPGRAVHVHLRVRVDDRSVLTGQLYFDDDYTAGVYAEDPYAPFGLPDTTTAADFLAGDVATDGSRIRLAPTDEGTLGLVNVGIAV